MSRPYTKVGNTYKFLYAPVQGLDVLYLSSSEFSNLDIIGPGGSHDTLMCGIMTAPYAGAQDFSMTSGVFLSVPSLTTQQLSFQLRDRSYNILTIVPNISFVQTIQ